MAQSNDNQGATTENGTELIPAMWTMEPPSAFEYGALPSHPSSPTMLEKKDGNAEIRIIDALEVGNLPSLPPSPTQSHEGLHITTPSTVEPPMAPLPPSPTYTEVPSPQRTDTPASDNIIQLEPGTEPGTEVGANHEEVGEDEGSVSTQSSEKNKHRKNHRAGVKNREKVERKASLAVPTQQASPASSVCGAKKSHRAGVQARRRREQRELYRMTSQGMEPLDGDFEYDDEEYEDDHEDHEDVHENFNERVVSDEIGAESNTLEEEFVPKDITPTLAVPQNEPLDETPQIQDTEADFEPIDVTHKIAVEKIMVLDEAPEATLEVVAEPVEAAAEATSESAIDVSEELVPVDVTMRYNEPVPDLANSFEPVDVTYKNIPGPSEETESFNAPSLTYDSDDNHSEHEVAEEPQTEEVPGSPYPRLESSDVPVEEEETAPNPVKEKPVLAYVPSIPAEVKVAPATAKPAPKPAVKHSVKLLSLMRPIVKKN